MVKRSIKAGSAGIRKAKKEFNRRNLTQASLADEVNLKTRQPIWRFFSGHPIERQCFKEICRILELDWREIADDEQGISKPTSLPQRTEEESFAYLKKVRSQHYDKIVDQCGTLQLLDISHPVDLEDIYIDVNVLQKTTHSTWLDLSELQSQGADAFDRIGMGNIIQQQVPGIEAVQSYSRLRVLGKPGSGKTTFLQFIAMQCNQGKFALHQIPVFVHLIDFAETSKTSGEYNLLHYIFEELLTTDISSVSILEALLFDGSVLLLLDGLDEVPQQQSKMVCSEIRRFSEKYYKNLFVISCRIALKHYQLKNFTDVEIAPFTQAQITTFSHKWFGVFTKSSSLDNQAKANHFLHQLDLSENWQFRKLTVTPLFLHLACWIFYAQDKFPVKRSEFYKQCLDLLLVRWDEAKGIQRDEIYQGFSLAQKMKLLSQIAAVMFEQGHHFFDQRDVEKQIDDYITNLPGITNDPEVIRLESEAILKSIEVQHGVLTERAKGIFSFSYLAFQEYLTARKIVASHNLKALERALERLVLHVTDPSWRETFLLTASMLRSSDSLVQLMKQQIDALVAEDPYLQKYLAWASKKSLSISEKSTVSSNRAFYLALARTPLLSSHFALACMLDQNKLLDTALDNLLLSCAIDNSCNFAHVHACADALSNALTMILDVGLYKSLEQLQEQLPDTNQSQERFQAWCQSTYLVWKERLNEVVSEHRDIGHHWDFSPEQQQTLDRYYAANQLLVDCLNSNCEITEGVRQQIENTLLLPQLELEEREWQ